MIIGSLCMFTVLFFVFPWYGELKLFIYYFRSISDVSGDNMVGDVIQCLLLSEFQLKTSKKVMLSGNVLLDH